MDEEREEGLLRLVPVLVAVGVIAVVGLLVLALIGPAWYVR